MTPCFAINYGGIFIMTSILLLLAKCKDQLCSNCTEQQITRKVPGKCDVCWPCSECYVGSGLSVGCGTTVSRDADIVCVACTRGVNFSDTSGSEQCQPCATCTGKHEHVLENCSPERNVKCECEDGYYRNRTTKECLPCVSCCTDNWKIAKRCTGRGDEGEIAKKCKFKIPLTKACFSLSVSSTIGDASKPIEHHSSVVVVTSPSLMKQSSLHPTATPLLERMTVSKTVQIKATSLSTPGYSRQISHHSVIVTILVSLFIFIVLGMFVLIVGCVVKYFLKKYKSKKSVGASQNDMEEGTENDDGESSVTGSVIIPLLQGTEDPYEIPSVPLENDKTGETTDFSRNLPSSADQEGQGVNVQIEKGIPTSLDNEPRSKGQRPRKQIPSEEEDKKEPCLDGQQHHSYTDHYDEEPHTTVTVDKMLVSFHRDSPQPTGLPAIRGQGSSSRNDAVPNSVVAFSPSDAEQMSGSHLSAQLDLGISDVNQAAGCPLVKQPIQPSGCNRGYSTHINDVPNSLINPICILLDEERDIDGKDYTMLASMLNQTPVTIRHLKQQQRQSGKSPSYRLLLQIFASMKNSGTLKCLCSILEKMERHDVISIIDLWVANNP